MIEPGDRVFAAFPNTDSNSLGGLLADAIHAIGAHICCMTGQETYYELANLVRSRDCNVYVGAPVLLLSLLRLLGEASPLKRALVSGDVCHDVVVKACEERLGSRLFPHYGLRESGLGAAMSCQAHCGMHIRENDMLFEIIDDEGQPLPDGSWGELVLTSFGMEAMPLFRYRTGDRGRILAGPCPCGSLVKRLEVSGRLRSTSQLTRLDGRLFACKALVDAKIAEDGLVLLALPGQELAPRQLEGISESTAVYVRSITAEDRPFFSGKRK
ncbi:MAG: AMP-binding protein [Oscillospiraceae bacterium]|nr:AMP-binding protein [Oscillospiraceae bacterium]